MVKHKKFTLAGGEHSCIVQQYKGPVKEVMKSRGMKMRAWKEGDADPGYIIGTAIHFIPAFLVDREKDCFINSDGVERFTCTGPWPHDNLINGLRYNDDTPMSVQTHDDEQTVYGFVTSEGFFVDRCVAGKIWKEMLAAAGWRDDTFNGEYTPSLFSYNLKPEVIEHHEKESDAKSVAQS